MGQFGVGQAVRRKEDNRLLTGGGRYTDDTKLNAPAARMYVLRDGERYPEKVIWRNLWADPAKAAAHNPRFERKPHEMDR